MDALARPVRPTDFGDVLTKTIPSTGEAVPVVGMGTWITFNVGDDQALRDHRTGILREFFRRGGRMIDCSPMYGSSAEVLGYGLSRLETTDGLFSASKVWTSWTSGGPEQIGEQRRLWGVDGFDLMQVHNLKNWEGHLETLREMKAEGQVRYIGVTTSHGRRHDELIRVMETQDLDFIQVTYNILDRAVEDRILPLARDRGMAVIANRPYRQKGLFRLFQDKPLPPWAEEQADAVTWADFFLKFIVSHPAVTCAIPATSQLPHLRENMAAATGRLPDEKTRARMAQYVETL
ncbi:aldo/keto reductase [Roseospira navarrensis]|uniref:Aldo/keto reductase n=2 Tax=Roseospira navarrensis TaxID=140058 RepID=A0A7X2D2L4_9PROT|nr:aldo/keto reductase [Roseospira navarrensis]